MQLALDFEPTQEEKTARQEAVIELLSRRPMTTAELESDSRIVCRVAAVIDNLRQAGWQIKTRKHTTGLALYELLGKVPMVKVTPKMKENYYILDHWRNKRLERLRFDGFVCVVCQSPDLLHVHHWKYDLFNEQVCDLMTLCETCHVRMHEYPNVHCHFPKWVTPEIAELLK